MRAVAIHDISVGYGRHRVIDRLALEVPLNGCVVGLFGPNGAGKTTLIRALAGIINSYSGRIAFPEGVRPAYLPDFPFLYPFLSIRQAIGLFDSMFADFDPDVAGRLFDHLGLSDRLTIGECSKGMGEQVHLSLMLARRTGLYLFDEPLAAVDPLTRDQVIQLIQEFRAPSSTAIISTHLIAGLEGLFDDVMVMYDGKILAYDTTENLGRGKGLEEAFKEMVREHLAAR